MKLKIKIENHCQYIKDCVVTIDLQHVITLNYDINQLYYGELIKFKADVDKKLFKNLDYIYISIKNKNEVNSYKDYISFNGYLNFDNLEYLPKQLTFIINSQTSSCHLDNITCNEIEYLKACQKIGACIDATKIKIIKSNHELY